MTDRSKELVWLSHAEFMAMLTNQELQRDEDIGYLLYHTTYEATIDNDLCSGRVKSIQIREGISFQIIEAEFRKDTRVEMISNQPQVGFIFYLEGRSLACIDESNEKDKGPYQLDLHPNVAVVYANTYSKGPQYYYAGKKVVGMFIHFSYDSFRELFSDSIDEIPQALRQTLINDSTVFMKSLAMTPAVRALCYTLLNNPFRGKSKEFFVEAKVIELIAHQIDSLSTAGDVLQESHVILANTEKEKVTHAYQELQKNLANPPSLIELAKKVGLSVYRLKNGLRQQYGDTPYRILAELRMLEAKALLERGELNVGEVAYEVGFLSIGSFSNAFADRFGFRPSAIRS